MNGGGPWAIFNAVLGWTNSATYGSVIAYNIYWVVVIAQFWALRFRELHGRWPLTKSKLGDDSKSVDEPRTSEDE